MRHEGVEKSFAAGESQYAKYRRMMALYGSGGVWRLAWASRRSTFRRQARFPRDRSARLQTVAHNRSYQKIATLMGQITATASMRDTSLFYRAHANPETPNPVPALRELAQAWSEFPKIALGTVGPG